MYNAYQAYQDNGVMTSSPGKLLLMAFDGAIRFLRQGEAAIREDRRDEQSRCLTQAQKIIIELTCTLNHQIAPDLCSQLARLYDYMVTRLVEANVHDDAAPVLEVIRHLETLRSGFAEAHESVARTAAPAPELVALRAAA